MESRHSQRTSLFFVLESLQTRRLKSLLFGLKATLSVLLGKSIKSDVNIKFTVKYVDQIWIQIYVYIGHLAPQGLLSEFCYKLLGSVGGPNG